MAKWQTIDTAPKDGRPVWVRGWDWNKPGGARHCYWAYYEDGDWYTQGAEEEKSVLKYLDEWMPNPLSLPTDGKSDV